MECCVEKVTLTPQEQWHLNGVYPEMQERQRAFRIYEKIRNCPVTVDMYRARLFTESFKLTEGQPLHWRWAQALMHIAENMPIVIDEDDVIVGKMTGKMGRYAVVYPELEGPTLLDLENAYDRPSSPVKISSEDLKILKEEIYPYWKDRSFAQDFAGNLPEETRRLLYGDDPKNFSPMSSMIGQTATTRSTLNFNFNYEYLLNRGIAALRKESEMHITKIENEPALIAEKKSFVDAALLTWDAFSLFIERYGLEAERLIGTERRETRKEELKEIADSCLWIAHNAPRTFKEALQLQWFVVVFACLEQKIGAALGNGRTDQHLYPFYKNDIKNGRLTREGAKRLFEYYWLNMAQNPMVPLTNSASKSFEAYAHFETVTIGGVDKNGNDATNELSYVILESKRGFPIPYPDLAARIHSGTPDKFLKACCEVIKDGQGFPKLLNDEEIVPLYVAKGATLADAYNYACSGCTEVRIFDKETYITGGGSVNLGAIIETALHNGRMKVKGEKPIGVETGDPRDFDSFEKFYNAINIQMKYALKNLIIQQVVAEKVKAKKLAAPFCSVMTKACREQDIDIHQYVPNSFRTANINLIGYATYINSVVAIKKLVFEDKKYTMAEILEGIDANFDGYEVMRQELLHAPKYGNNDDYADSVGLALDREVQEYLAQHRGAYGEIFETRVIPITGHISYGWLVQATPDGRLAGTPLSEGTAGSAGTENNGPTAILLSNKKVKNEGYAERAARLLNIKFSPSVVAGDEGTKRLMAFIRTWCDLKLWHVQFNIVNKETMLKAQKDPENYKDLIVRVAGYSAYFTEMTKKLQDEIIERAEFDV